MPCSNAAKTRNPLKFAGVPQSTGRCQPLVGRRSPYCGNIWRRYCCLTSFFPIVDTCLSCEEIARQSCAMVPRFLVTFLRPVFSASLVHHVSDLHPKFALRRGKKRKKKKEEERNRMKLECGPVPNLMVALPNIGGTLCSTPQSLADAHYWSAV